MSILIASAWRGMRILGRHLAIVKGRIKMEGFIVNFLSTVGGASTGIALICWLGRGWFENRLKASIDHDYNIKLESIKADLARQTYLNAEQVKRDMQVRDKASKIAELMGEWYSCPASKKHLNTLTIEAFLWLPDNIVSDLSKVLSHKEEAPDARVVMHAVRQYLIGQTTIEPWQFIVFPSEPEAKIASAPLEASQA
jgi:hypothetical protein